MKYYEVIETNKKFDRNDIVSEYYFNDGDFCILVNLDNKTPVCKIPFVRLYLTKVGNDNKVIKLFGVDKKIVVLLKEELEKIYTDEDDGYILSDDFEQHIYECEVDSELNEKIQEIGTQIIKKTFFTDKYPVYNRSIRLSDNKMIISLNFLCFVDLLEKEDIKIDYCDKLEKKDIVKIIYDLLLNNMECILLSELFDSIKDFLVIIEKKYGKINNIYEVQKEYIQEINDMFSPRTLIIETEEKIIIINTGVID